MPSENVPTSGTGDRRSRKREARRERLLDLAGDLVDSEGVAGVTMAALAEAADYAPASLYTYFPSRSALMAAVQERALRTLGEVGTAHLAATEAAAAAAGVGPQVAALARLCAFSDLFLVAPVRYPREFRLQQELLVTRGVEEVEDAGRIVPVAMYVLDAPRRLLADAVDVGALATGESIADPLGAPVDAAVARTLAWVVALNGALLTDGLLTGLPTTGAVLGAQLTDALLVGWGARREDLAAARPLARSWAPLATPSTADLAPADPGADHP
ncbi:TetR family transcriptional regulator [Aquihabitans sp. G128]|uniref:TetR family transcriptional regulator n=1 Tax=Aquihabitans sp. G128 TaxID=2849779 RepID=UPI001C24B239|nr:TetR family transcriptional regulator [Aquihabitans sp. G128]QXC63052.1 TetR family transcriptional regulator [Aquihabitans sp. G128]